MQRCVLVWFPTTKLYHHSEHKYYNFCQVVKGYAYLSLFLYCFVLFCFVWLSFLCVQILENKGRKYRLKKMAIQQQQQDSTRNQKKEKNENMAAQTRRYDACKTKDLVWWSWFVLFVNAKQQATMKTTQTSGNNDH